MGIAPLQIPEVVEVPVRKDDKAAVLRLGVSPRLLFADEGVFGLCLGFEDDKRKSLFVQKEEVDEAPADGLEVFSESIEVLPLHRSAGLELDVG